MLSLLRRLSWPELLHHPWRNAAALAAVMLGVALAYSVHLINASALAEFSAAVRAVNGDPDLELVGPRAGFDETLYARVAADAAVSLASPVVDGEVVAFDASGARVPLRVVGVDALVVASLAPALLPRPDAGADRFSALDPRAAFLNAAAAQRLAPGRAASAAVAADLVVQAATGRHALRIAGSIAAAGPPLAVLDIAGAQVLLGSVGRLTRIDVRLAPGADREALLARLALPAGMRAAVPGEATERVSNVSRAYRVNLTVLALVAMFTGAFLVFSILSLSVAKRQQQLALLGVLGLGARERMALVLGESAGLGLAGSVLGLALGLALAATALRLFGGDLGGGYFPGVAPALRVDVAGIVVYGALGVVAAVMGGWLPARAAADIAPALALKSLGAARSSRSGLRIGLALIGLGAGLAFLPPIAGIPLAAYASVACLLIGGIACVPAGVGLALAGIAPPRRPLALLAVERARHQRDSATIAVAGVVASLALSVALTVMVASFREAVIDWLDTILPADLYARAAGGPPGSEVATLPPALPERARTIAGVMRAEAQRVVSTTMDPSRPAVALIARPLADPAASLPLTGALLPAPAGATAVFVSEAMADLYGATPGRVFALPLPDGRRVEVFVRGVWRDYARQFGAVMIDAADWRRLTGDERINDLALWLAPEARLADVEAELRRLSAAEGHDGALLEFAAPRDIRATSLRIFDRSFAVTYWLQAVAIAIGLFGIAASFSAQVLARRKEFGLLVHLGLTRRQIVAVVGAEGAVWTAVGAALGLALGIAVSVVLVKVVNPQSFHWTMELLLPWLRLGALCAAVVVAGTVTALLSARRAVGRQSVLAVKEDW
ncbi:MAG TPA: ABC transporter permease [Caldimonas sp.]|nr:ABC transporter permease [Caldimonas sp.]HEX2541828.1 ABC transporter permease [Caldimonas sp.]